MLRVIQDSHRHPTIRATREHSEQALLVASWPVVHTARMDTTTLREDWEEVSLPHLIRDIPLNLPKVSQEHLWPNPAADIQEHHLASQAVDYLVAINPVSNPRAIPSNPDINPLQVVLVSNPERSFTITNNHLPAVVVAAWEPFLAPELLVLQLVPAAPPSTMH